MEIEQKNFFSNIMIEGHAMFKKDPMSKPMTHERIIDSLKMAIPIAIYAIIYLTWFHHLEVTPQVHYTEVHTALDDKIPFLEIFVVPYFAWFFYVSFVVLYFLFKYEKEDYYKLLSFLITGMTVFLIVSTLFPNIQHLRPTTMPRDNIFTHMVAYLYKTDTPTNLWPSIHVYNSIGVFIGAYTSKRVSRRGKIFSGVLSTLIILSTMFIKQHSTFDVATAFALGLIVYVIVYRSELVVGILHRHDAEEEERAVN